MKCPGGLCVFELDRYDVKRGWMNIWAVFYTMG